MWNEVKQKFCRCSWNHVRLRPKDAIAHLSEICKEIGAKEEDTAWGTYLDLSCAREPDELLSKDIQIPRYDLKPNPPQAAEF